MLSLAYLLAAGSALSFTSAQRTMTVVNQCNETLWPAMYTEQFISELPDQATGWEMEAGNVTSFIVPKNWSGRIWGRKECDFSEGNQGANSCKTGGCNGGLECAKEGGTGVAPTTLAEFTFDSSSGDWYDISLVDGFDNNMSITNDADCSVPSCKTDINRKCPEELQLKTDNGDVIGCLTACSANLDGDQSNSPNCCSGDYDTPETCASSSRDQKVLPASGVQNYNIFKDSCKDAYAYAYDEDSKSALWKCDSSKQANFTVTFCPSEDNLTSASSATVNSTKKAAGRHRSRASRPALH